VTRPRLLDLFSGAGGAAMGYHRAGFDVVGVDLDEAQLAQYPFPAIRADAMAVLAGGIVDLDAFDVIHASPPCQGFTPQGARDGRWPDLLTPTLAALQSWGGTWVVENVPGSGLAGLLVCGQALGLGVRRHRLFASNVWLMGPGCACGRPGTHRAYYGKGPGRTVWRVDGVDLLFAGTVAQAPDDMGIAWMDWTALREAIPPAYTQHIGEQLLEALTPPHQGAHLVRLDPDDLAPADLLEHLGPP
jgi:DNA (cytosine-5)-methyltransferase 1